MNVFLIGYRATGKSTVAEILAIRLGWPWIDTDREIERRAGKPIAEIFSHDGEAAFRDLETTVVKDVAMKAGQIVSLGGGAVLREENRQALAGRGKMVWLRSSVAAIQRRLLADPRTSASRPSLTPRGLYEEVEHVLAQRTPIYAACADLAIDIDDKQPQAIAEEIIALLHLRDSV
jgi:shikimate kinase